jgi:hypothetical protein
MIREKNQRWQLIPDSPIDEVLTAFVARRIMKVTKQQPDAIEVTGGSALAVGMRAKALDWLPVRGRISFREGADGYTDVEASIGPRGRPHLRRRLFAELYEQKLSSWLADLDRTIRANAKDVRDVATDTRA